MLQPETTLPLNRTSQASKVDSATLAKEPDHKLCKGVAKQTVSSTSTSRHCEKHFLQTKQSQMCSANSKNGAPESISTTAPLRREEGTTTCTKLPAYGQPRQYPNEKLSPATRQGLHILSYRDLLTICRQRRLRHDPKVDTRAGLIARILLRCSPSKMELQEYLRELITDADAVLRELNITAGNGSGFLRDVVDRKMSSLASRTRRASVLSSNGQITRRSSVDSLVQNPASPVAHIVSPGFVQSHRMHDRQGTAQQQAEQVSWEKMQQNLHQASQQVHKPQPHMALQQHAIDLHAKTGLSQHQMQFVIQALQSHVQAQQSVNGESAMLLDPQRLSLETKNWNETHGSMFVQQRPCAPPLPSHASSSPCVFQTSNVPPPPPTQATFFCTVPTQQTGNLQEQRRSSPQTTRNSEKRPAPSSCTVDREGKVPRHNPASDEDSSKSCTLKRSS